LALYLLMLVCGFFVSSRRRHTRFKCDWSSDVCSSDLVWEATGMAERYAALEMLEEVPGMGRVTVGGDKGFDTADFVRECRNLHMTPHVAQNLGRRGGSNIDSRNTRHTGYDIRQKKRIRNEECF